MSGNYRGASSIIDHKSNPLRFTGSGYKQHSPDRGRSRAGGTIVRSGSRPTALSGTSYNSAIIRKPSHKEAAGPFDRSSSPSQVWDAQKSYIIKKLPESHSLFSPQTGRYWSTSRGHSSGYKETNELAAATSTGIQSSKFLSFASQTVPHAPSISNGLDASVIKSIPSLEKLTSSITDSSQGPHKTPKVHSYLFKDSQTSYGGHETAHDGAAGFSTTPHEQRASDGQLSHRFSSNVIKSQRENPNKDVSYLSVNADPLYHNDAQYGAPTDSFTQYPNTSPAPEKDPPMTHFVSLPKADFQRNYATGREKSAISSFINETRRGSVQAYKPGGVVKSIYGFRGFEKPEWRAESSRGYKGQDSKIANPYQFMSSKYSFGQRESPAKLMRTPTGYSSPSPGTFIRAKNTPKPGTDGGRPLLPESDAGTDSNPERRQFRVSNRIYGVKGFRPHEGAKTSVSEPVNSARLQQGFEGFKLRSTQPKSSRIHIWDGKTIGGSSHVSTMRTNELSSEDFKPLLKTTGSAEFTPGRYKKTRKIYTFLGFRPVQNRIGKPDEKTLLKHKKLDPTTAPPSQMISSTSLISAEKLPIQSSPQSESKTPNKTRPVAMEVSSSTSSTVRGRRVKLNGKNRYGSSFFINKTRNAAIFRPPKRPVKVIAITYTDILGSASFSGVAATTQTTITPADKDYFPNTTATTGQEEEAGNWSLNSTEAAASRSNGSSPEAHVEVDFSRVEGNKTSVVEGDGDVETSDFFMEREGSGSEGFNVTDVVSSTKSLGLSEDLLELDYLQISAGNFSKSTKQSHVEK
ncbi:uncharacterized protein LOC131989678 isoform X2 [Centropristis striata]|nr:uncharacterized protein LOC131989678 isoform X2 [Centropristis striata]